MTGPALYIVDDESDMGSFVSDVAEDMGFETKSVTSAKELMALVEDRLPSGIVMDVVMPDMDGIELVQWLGKRGYLVPIILMSGFDSQYINVAESLGTHHGAMIAGSLRKPFTASELELHLNQILESAK